MIIRPLTEQDLDEVLVIEQSSYKNPWSLEHFRNELANEEVCNNYVAVHNQKIIGYSGFYRLFEVASITKITVAEEYRQQGIGDVLLKDLLGRAKDVRCERAILEVRVSNKIAIQLYKKNHFVEIGIRKGYYQDGEDALILERNLG